MARSCSIPSFARGWCTAAKQRWSVGWQELPPTQVLAGVKQGELRARIPQVLEQVGLGGRGGQGKAAPQQQGEQQEPCEWAGRADRFTGWGALGRRAGRSQAGCRKTVHELPVLYVYVL